MTHFALRLILLLLATSASAGTYTTQRKPEATELLGARYVALSPHGNRLCFEYQGDLWVASATGGTAARLTVNRAYDGWPRWSPDGRWIAFTSNRSGHFDVYIVPATGGAPTRLTWHSAGNVVEDWSPDGRRILFRSARSSPYTNLYTVDIQTLGLRRVTRDLGANRFATYNASGTAVLLTRGRQEWWRPLYKGSGAASLYEVNLRTQTETPLIQTTGLNAWPMVGASGALFFVSSRGGVANIWAVRGAAAAPEQLTNMPAPGVRFPGISRDGSRIAFELNSRVYVTSTRHGSVPKLISLQPSGEVESDPVVEAQYRTQASALAMSRDGTQLAFAVRGEIWTVPAHGGECRRITTTTAVQTDPQFTLNGRMLAYTGDQAGSMQVYLDDLATGAQLQVTHAQADCSQIQFAPNGTLISWVQTGGTAPGVYAAPITTPQSSTRSPLLPDASSLLAPGSQIVEYAWSPDGHWLAYSQRTAFNTADLWLVPGVGGTAVNVTQWPTVNRNPRWAPDGRFLYFISSRGGAAGVRSPATQDSLYRLDLNPSATAGRLGIGVPRPIELDGISDRAEAIVAGGGALYSMDLTPDGRAAVCRMSSPEGLTWAAVDLQTRQVRRIAQAPDVVGKPVIMPSGTGFLYTDGAGDIQQVQMGVGEAVPLFWTAMMTMNLRGERLRAFTEAWSLLNTRFYDSALHGANWAKLRDAYRNAAANARDNVDFADVLNALAGELNASHLGATPPAPIASLQTGELGVEWDPQYPGPGLRIAQVLQGGPADMAQSRLNAGDYVLALDGQPVTYNERLYQLLQDRAGQDVTLTVNLNPVPASAYEIKIHAVDDARMRELEYGQWVRSRADRVAALSGGVVGYVAIPRMDAPAISEFSRDLLSRNEDKRAVIVDVRFNPGGNTHDTALQLLDRRPYAFETPRDAPRATQPFELWNRPLVLLVNEYSASDSEVLAHALRQLKLATIVGTTTPGAVIGTQDVRLVDGTVFRVPQTRWQTLDGAEMEGHGLVPDITVETTPNDVHNNRDPQLDAAVEALMNQLKP